MPTWTTHTHDWKVLETCVPGRLLASICVEDKSQDATIEVLREGPGHLKIGSESFTKIFRKMHQKTIPKKKTADEAKQKFGINRYEVFFF